MSEGMFSTGKNVPERNISGKVIMLAAGAGLALLLVVVRQNRAKQH